ncbi:MAG: flavodoxin family protein [Coprococcus sp.]
MKIAVRFQSRGGNTKAVAEIIAKKAGVKAETVEVAVDEYVDVLFVGGGVYMGKMDESLYNFLSELNSDNIGQIVCFSSTGTMDTTLRQIKAISSQKGILVNERKLLIPMFLRGHSSLGFHGGKLTGRQISKIERFTNDVLKAMNVAKGEQ